MPKKRTPKIEEGKKKVVVKDNMSGMLILIARELSTKHKLKKKRGRKKNGMSSNYNTYYDEKYPWMQAAHDFVRECSDYYDADTNRVVVRLPSIERFGSYLGVIGKTVMSWRKDHPENLQLAEALHVIEEAQKQRLLENSISGLYEKTISALVLNSNHGLVRKSEVKGEHEHNHSFSLSRLRKGMEDTGQEIIDVETND